MDEEFTLAARSRLDKLEDLLDGARDALTTPLYSDDYDEIDKHAAMGMLALIELERAARALLTETAGHYKSRAGAS